MTDVLTRSNRQSSTPIPPSETPTRRRSAVSAETTLSDLGPIVVAIRWATTVGSVMLVSRALIEGDLGFAPWLAIIVCNTIVRTITPYEFSGSVPSLLNLLIEVGLHVAAVIATGYWDSPLVLSLMVAVIVAGLAGGFGFGTRIAFVSAVAVSLPQFVLEGVSLEQFMVSGRWAGVLVLAGVVAGYSRRLSGEADARHTRSLHRLSQMADANALLVTLYEVAQSLPASLDEEEALDSIVSRLHSVVDLDRLAIFSIDGDHLHAARKSNLRVSGIHGLDDLPADARVALETRSVVACSLDPEQQGIDVRSRSGLYAPLVARRQIIGLIAVEADRTGAFGPREQDAIASFISSAALAVDNARLFGRIRVIGADEERARIARDIHDRIGQSLAYLGVEADRIIRLNDRDEPIERPLAGLRADIRGVVREVRDTLYDLRTDVSEERGLVDALNEHAPRVAERAGLSVELDVQEDVRLPVLQEREMWRILREALTNIERHAAATAVEVTWRCDGKAALLGVADNGRGFDASNVDRVDSYGLLGMRERATSVGATLEISSVRGEGTHVQCFLRPA